MALVSTTGHLVSSIAGFAILLSAVVLLAPYPGDPHAVVASALREFALIPQFGVAGFAAPAGVHKVRLAGCSGAGRTILAVASVLLALPLVSMEAHMAAFADVGPVRCTGWTCGLLTIDATADVGLARLLPGEVKPRVALGAGVALVNSAGSSAALSFLTMLAGALICNALSLLLVEALVATAADSVAILEAFLTHHRCPAGAKAYIAYAIATVATMLISVTGATFGFGTGTKERVVALILARQQAFNVCASDPAADREFEAVHQLLASAPALGHQPFFTRRWDEKTLHVDDPHAMRCMRLLSFFDFFAYELGRRDALFLFLC